MSKNDPVLAKNDLLFLWHYLRLAGVVSTENFVMPRITLKEHHAQDHRAAAVDVTVVDVT